MKLLLEAPKNITDRLDADFEGCLHPRILDILAKFNLTTKDLRRLYFGRDKITEQSVEKYVDMCGDLHFNLDIHDLVKTQIEKSPSPTYMYHFTYDKGFSIVKKHLDIKIKGKILPSN